MSITVSIQVRLNSVDPGVAFVGGHGFVVAVPLFLIRYSLSSVLTKGFILFFVSVFVKLYDKIN